MFRILESQAPAKQTATDTINTLSSRLQSVTLLEDKRAAILGLRSFAKIYPASVASGALRPLISSLRNDQEDVDTIKVVLETLLNLFSPDESSPEASDEIALWLADEFTQRQDNITTLLDLLESREFYPRLYSLQLISLISSARPERTQECIFTAPLGIPRLVSTLSDVREPVRNEALVLLIALTPASEELQKLVAFENAFDIVFTLIEAEGALTHGSEIVEDCLALLANLLKLNISNQSYFRETGCMKKLAKLLADVNQDQDQEGRPSQYILAHRDKNIWGTLVIIQLFLAKGGVYTPANQTGFWYNGVMEQVLNLAFGQRFTVNVTSKALATCADLIRGNSSLQEQFGDVEVFWGTPHTERKPNGEVTVNGVQRVNVIEALLKLSLEPASIQQLDARLAACECIKAFFANHQGIRMHVLRRAIDGHLSGQDEIPNILSVLFTPPESRGNSDPYQTWIASVLMFHLVFEDAEAKAMAMKVTEGDAESGEEVITCVQTIVGHLITGLQRNDDERISIGYLMLLCGWLFEDPDVVDDFLNEGSSIQSLLQETKHRAVPNVLLSGLCTILLGIIYEFSSRDSPISRHTLHKLLIGQLGRDQYVDKVTKFRESPLVRDFEVLPQNVGANYDGGLPEIFFDRTFIEFLKDNFSRLLRAIDREPGLEISVITNGVQRGISREMVDTLREELEDRNKAVQKLESDLLGLQHKLEHEQFELKEAADSNAVEAAKIKQVNEALQRNHEQELQILAGQGDSAKNELLRQHSDQLRNSDNQLKQTSADYEQKSEQARRQHETEVAELQETISIFEMDLARVKEISAGETANLRKAVQALESELAKAQEQHAGEAADLRDVIQNLKSDAGKVKEQHAAELAEQNKSIQELQSSLDTVKSEHEKEVAGYKSTIETLQANLNQAREKATQDTQAVHDEYSAKLSALEKLAEVAEQRAESAEANASNNTKELKTRTIEAERKIELAELNAKRNAEELETRAKEAERRAEEAESNAKKNAEDLEKQAEEAETKAKQTEADTKQRAGDLEKRAEQAERRAESAEASAKEGGGELATRVKEVEQKAEEVESNAKKTTSDLEKRAGEAEGKLKQAEADTKKQTADLEKRAEEAERKAKQAEENAKKHTDELQALQAQLEKVQTAIKEKEEASKSAQSALDKAQSQAKEKEEARQATQSELDDLLIVFGDLEMKRNEDKKRLKELGQDVSDDEQEEDDDSDNEDVD